MFSQHVTFSLNLHQSLPQSGPKITFGSHFGLGQASPGASGGPPAHSVSQGCSFLENWVSKGSLGPPLGHSSGLLCAHLWPLCQHMVAMLVLQRPNVLKVTSVHLVCCGINVVKTDVFTTCHLFCKFAPKLFPRAPKSDLWLHFGHIWRHFAGFLASFGPFVAHLRAHYGFSGILWGRASPRSLPAAGAQRAVALWENSIWTSRARVSPREYAHPAKLWYVPQRALKGIFTFERDFSERGL